MFLRHNFRSECYSIGFSADQERPLLAAAFADQKLRVWNINEIMQDGKKLDEPKETLDAVELGPVDVQVCGSRIGVSSIDGSLKVFEYERGLIADSNRHT